MRYSKSFIPIQACNPCTWCYFESDFITFGFLLLTLWLAIHFMLIRSLILALLISIGLSYMIITLVLVAWNLAAIRELNKTRMKLESKH